MDLATGQPVGEPFTGHTGAVESVAVGELGGQPVAVSGSSDHTVRVWDLATGRGVCGPFTVHRGKVLAVAVVKLRGRPAVISGSSDRSVRVWDLASGRRIRGPLTGHTGWVLAVTAARPGVVNWWFLAPPTRRCGYGTWPVVHR